MIIINETRLYKVIECIHWLSHEYNKKDIIIINNQELYDEAKKTHNSIESIFDDFKVEMRFKFDWDKLKSINWCDVVWDDYKI